MCLCVHLFVGVCKCEQVPLEARFSTVGISGGFEPPDVDAENWTGVPCKSLQCS